jgi:hypothetical protein
VEQQHQQLLDPSFSLSEIRNKRRVVIQNFNAQRKQYKEGEVSLFILQQSNFNRFITTHIVNLSKFFFLGRVHKSGQRN